MNYSLQTSSSPVAIQGLPSPNLTEPSLSSPKTENSNGIVMMINSASVVSSDSNTFTTTATSTNTSTSTSSCVIPTPNSTTSASPILSAMLRSLPKSSKELNITEYSNKELKSMKKRCRTVMTPAQSRVLRKVLEQTAFPSTEIRENLAKLLGMKPRTVQIWFQNQRQKSRQGRSSDDLTVMGSPSDSCNSDGNGTDIEDPLGSPYDTGSSSTPSNSSQPINTSPGFNALTAAAFALSSTTNPPLEPSTAPPASSNPNSSEHQRYTTFHGAVYKSVPGCMPMPSYRGNTAAAINAKRMATAAAAAAQGQAIQQSFIPGSSDGFSLPPSQPLKIPAYNAQSHSQSLAQAHSQPQSSSIPLDILASAVSNFRPNGYNYYMQVPSGRNSSSPPLHPPQMNRNRLAPLRTVSPPSSTSTTLPSLKALAQVASIGMEQLECASTPFPTTQRSKSLTEMIVDESSSMKFNRRFSAIEQSSASSFSVSAANSNSNVTAPNNSSSTASLRRPW